MRRFYEKNELTYYCETLDEVDELALKLPQGTIIIMNKKNPDETSELRAFMVHSDHTAVEV